MSCRNDCPACGPNPPKMWHDGDRWNCLCGWQGDEDGWLIADAMARAKVAPVECGEPCSVARDKYQAALRSLGEIGPMDVVLVHVRHADATASWRVLAKENLHQGTCGCCFAKVFDVADVIEVRRVRLTVDEASP